MENNIMLCIANPLDKSISSKEILFLKKVIFEIHRSYSDKKLFVYFRNLPETYVNFIDQFLSDFDFIDKIFIDSDSEFTSIVNNPETLIAGMSFNGEHINKLNNTNRMISYMRFNV